MTRTEFLNQLPWPPDITATVLAELAQVIEIHISALTVATVRARRGGRPDDAQRCHAERVALERLVRWIKSPDMDLRYNDGH